ncbi:MAG: phosphatidate cytidylyltransferase, partial [Candidatus Xenobia bacterium]
MEKTEPEVIPAPPGRRRPRSLGVRIVFGLLMASLSLALISAGGLPLTLYALFVASVALHEFYALAEAKGHNPAHKTGIIGGMIIALAGMYLTERGVHTTVMWLTIAVYLAFLFGRAEASTMVDVGITQLGVLYVTWGFAHILLLRRIDIGPPLHLLGYAVSSGMFYTWLLAWVTAMCDVGCFAFGSMWGRHK